MEKGEESIENTKDNIQTAIENIQIPISNEVPNAKVPNTSKKRPFNKKFGFIFVIAIILAVSLLVFFNSKMNDSQDKITGMATDASQLKVEDKSFEDEENAVEDDKKTPPKEEPFDAKKETQNLENFDNLLMEEAKKQNMEVSDGEVDNYIQKSLEAYDMSEDELKQYLQNYGVTYQQYKDELKSKLTISELVNKNVDLDSVKVSEKEVNGFIEENSNDFQDVINDEEAYEMLKSRVRSKILADKQTELISEYVESLS